MVFVRSIQLLGFCAVLLSTAICEPLYNNVTIKIIKTSAYSPGVAVAGMPVGYGCSAGEASKRLGAREGRIYFAQTGSGKKIGLLRAIQNFQLRVRRLKKLPRAVVEYNSSRKAISLIKKLSKLKPLCVEAYNQLPTTPSFSPSPTEPPLASAVGRIVLLADAQVIADVTAAAVINLTIDRALYSDTTLFNLGATIGSGGNGVAFAIGSQTAPPIIDLGPTTVGSHVLYTLENLGGGYPVTAPGTLAMYVAAVSNNQLIGDIITVNLNFVGTPVGNERGTPTPPPTPVPTLSGSTIPVSDVVVLGVKNYSEYGVTYRSALVKGGIAVPENLNVRKGDLGQLRLYRKVGANLSPVPLSVEALSYWTAPGRTSTNAPIKWLEYGFISSDIAAQGREEYVLDFKNRSLQAQPITPHDLTVSENSSEIVIVQGNGSIAYKIQKDRVALPTITKAGVVVAPFDPANGYYLKDNNNLVFSTINNTATHVIEHLSSAVVRIKSTAKLKNASQTGMTVQQRLTFYKDGYDVSVIVQYLGAQTTDASTVKFYKSFTHRSATVAPGVNFDYVYVPVVPLGESISLKQDSTHTREFYNPGPNDLTATGTWNDPTPGNPLDNSFVKIRNDVTNHQLFLAQGQTVNPNVGDPGPPQVVPGSTSLGQISFGSDLTMAAPDFFLKGAQKLTYIRDVNGSGSFIWGIRPERDNDFVQAQGPFFTKSGNNINSWGAIPCTSCNGANIIEPNSLTHYTHYSGRSFRAVASFRLNGVGSAAEQRDFAKQAQRKLIALPNPGYWGNDMPANFAGYPTSRVMGELLTRGDHSVTALPQGMQLAIGVADRYGRATYDRNAVCNSPSNQTSCRTYLGRLYESQGYGYTAQQITGPMRGNEPWAGEPSMANSYDMTQSLVINLMRFGDEATPLLRNLHDDAMSIRNLHVFDETQAMSQSTTVPYLYQKGLLALGITPNYSFRHFRLTGLSLEALITADHDKLDYLNRYAAPYTSGHYGFGRSTIAEAAAAIMGHNTWVYGDTIAHIGWNIAGLIALSDATPDPVRSLDLLLIAKEVALRTIGYINICKAQHGISAMPEVGATSSCQLLNPISSGGHYGSNQSFMLSYFASNLAKLIVVLRERQGSTEPELTNFAKQHILELYNLFVAPYIPVQSSSGTYGPYFDMPNSFHIWKNPTLPTANEEMRVNNGIPLNYPLNPGYTPAFTTWGSILPLSVGGGYIWFDKFPYSNTLSSLYFFHAFTWLVVELAATDPSQSTAILNNLRIVFRDSMLFDLSGGLNGSLSNLAPLYQAAINNVSYRNGNMGGADTKTLAKLPHEIISFIGLNIKISGG